MATTNRLEVSFRTVREEEIPRVGRRKRVRVNGKAETMWIREVSVQAKKRYPGKPVYEGVAVLGEDLWA